MKSFQILPQTIMYRSSKHLYFFPTKKLISIENINVTNFRRRETFCSLGEPSYEQLRNTPVGLYTCFVFI